MSSKLHDEVRQSLKTATRNAVSRCGGADYAKDCTRVGKSQLSEYGLRQSPQFVPVDVAVDLDMDAQAPFILGAMANAEGYRLVPMHFGKGHIPRDLKSFAEKTSEVLQAGLESIEDGLVDVSEAVEVLKYIQEANIASAHIEAIMRKIIDDNQPHVVFPHRGEGAA
ncbi:MULTISPECIES: hypothetical protein [Acetobacter]|uniref:hypothetical protein n=1 Tax=Acetobacter TaxID=434 RepID=UPI000A3BE088|nr:MULTISPECIES: hypothetical protein [Acetobacter]NSL92933.1 hypothetical protein [Acetobacter syzygii]